LQIFVKTKTRRIAILNGKIVTGVLTQSAIIAYLAKHIHELPYSDKTCSELNIGFKKVISVDSHMKALVAFQMMAQHRITAVALVDTDNGQIITTISAKDIKEIDLLNPFKMLSQSTLKFVQYVRSREIRESMPIIHCSPHSTIADVIKKLSFLRIHRIFMVNEANLPVGVLSLGDILKILLDNKDAVDSDDE